jgi:RHS repeat-associated protein
VQDKSYNGLLRLESLKVKTPGQQTTLDLQSRCGKLQELQDRNRTDTSGAASNTRSDSFGYDNEVRLTRAQTRNNGSASISEAFTLDALANRTAHSAAAGPWSYDANNRLIQRGSGADAMNYTSDDAGNLTRKTEPGKVTRYFYDMQQRLVRVEDGSGNQLARYGYDPMSRRLWKEQYRGGNGNAMATSKRTLYLYADEGLIAEATQHITLNTDQSVAASGTAQISMQYGPMPNSLFGTDVMFVKTKNSNGADSFAYLHRDHLGTPVQATDKAGNVVWAARYDPFGKADIVTPAASASNPTITLNLRLPGQYLDDETGLHYNWHRFYDAQVGRCVTEDPVGLEGGYNRYAYVGGNPLSWIDPTGLRCTYSQGTGAMTCTDDSTGQTYYSESGYAGTGTGRNNPNAQGQQSVGPLPQGPWRVTDHWYNSPNSGRNTIRLTPLPGNQCASTGRDCRSFRIHGNNARNDASHGCAVLPPNRTQIPSGEIIYVVP